MIRTQGVRHVLLIHPSFFSRSKSEKLIENIRRKLLSRRIRIFSIKFERNFIILDVSDLAGARRILIGMFGIEKVSIAKKTCNDFSNVVNAIRAVGQEIILPKEKFLVKVELYENCLRSLGYKERDIEFASSGQLASELSSRGARPARSKDAVDRLVQSYINKKYAYVCIETTASLGGIPFGSQYHKVACSMHSQLSVSSCMASIRCGFLPEILLPYINKEDLKNKLRLSKSVIDMIDKKRYRIFIAHVIPPSSLNADTKAILLENIYYNMLTLLPGDVVIIPLPTTIFPTWYINSVINDVISAGKIPWTPFLFEIPEIKDYNIRSRTAAHTHIFNFESQVNYFSSHLRQLPSLDNKFDQELYEEHKQIINAVSRRAIETMKTISFKIGSNYVHDITDAI
jgi:hypothetical protein